jgi:hypothetical protein
MLIGVGSALCYAAALARFPLLAIYAQPIQNLTKLTNANAWSGLALSAGTLLLFLGYGAGAAVLSQLVDRSDTSRRGAQGSGLKSRLPMPLILLGFPLLFLALLLLVYPITSIDLYDYVFRGRMLTRYGANTFINVPIEFKDDPLFWYVAWRRAVTAYGPLWEGMSWLTALLAGEAAGAPGRDAARDAELLRLMLAYKSLAALGFLVCGAAIWWVLRRNNPQWRWLGLYLWLWNPLALWESLAAGHNDAWMAAAIVLAVGLMSTRQEEVETRRPGDRQMSAPTRFVSLSASLTGFVALTLGGLVKYLALMFGPVLLCAALRRLPDWRARLRLIVFGGLACAALILLAYTPFWVGWTTLRNFSDRGTLFTNSWLAVLQAPLTLATTKALIPAPRLLALLVPAEQAQQLAVAIGLGLLALGVLWAVWRAWQAPERVAEHTLWLLLWFLFLCNPWFQPWYLLWALALLALQPWRSSAARIVGVFCCTALLTYVESVYVLPLLGWHVDSAEWNALASAMLYGPPFLALLWHRRPVIGMAWRLSRLALAAREPAPSPVDKI